MSSDSYLWDKTGRRDAFVDALVDKLASKRPVRKLRLHMAWWLMPLAASAAALFIVIGCLGGDSAALRPSAQEPSTGDTHIVKTLAAPRETTRETTTPITAIGSVDDENETPSTDAATPVAVEQR